MARTTKQIVFAASYIRNIVSAVKSASSTFDALKTSTKRAAERYGKARAVRLAINTEVLKAFPKERRRSISAMLSMAWAQVLGGKRKKQAKRGAPVAQRLAKRYTLQQLTRAVEIKKQIIAEG
jgi:hypothetical protein